MQYYRQVQQKNPSAGKPKTLPQMSTSEAPFHKLSMQINFFLLKEDQCIKLEKKQQQ